ncbi:MAG: ATP-binding protein [Anaerolineae bacterium]
MPAGYFFVIYRRGYLGLDVVFSKMVIFVILAIAMVAAYGTGLLTIQGQFDFAPESIIPATIMLLPTLMLTIYSAKPIDRFVQGLVFGPVVRNQSLPEFASALSSKPELSTLASILRSVTQDFDIPQAALLLLDDTGLLSLAAQVNLTGWQPGDGRLQPFDQSLLRSAVRDETSHPLFAHPWIELALPVLVRENQIGFLALARPRGGYFNAEQVAFLRRVADMIAVGSEAIYLFKASRQLSMQLLSAQEMERRRLASLIHDQPLQILTFASHNIDGILADLRDSAPQAAQNLEAQAERIQLVMAELRDICVGLYPPVIDHGVEWVTEEVAEQFWQKFGLRVHKRLDLAGTMTYPPEVSTAVYKIITEALNNVVKHSRTQEAWVDLSYQDGVLTLVVADQGVGNRLHQCSMSEVVRQRHLGLAGMFRWADLMGGHLSLVANEPHGTKVILEIPLADE